MMERLGELADADETDRKAEKTVSEQAKTIRDAYHQFIDADSTTESTVHEFLTCYGSYHLTPGADVVVTAEGLEAGATAACDAFNEACDNESGEMTGQEAWLLTFRAALEACGIAVCNEVVALNGPLLWVKQNGDVVEMGDGDTLYIKRADTSKDGPGIDEGE